jgi:spore maturation protein CgeB
MRKVGWSPSVRLFEAAGCGVAIISDDWEGLSEVLTPGREILVAHTREDVLQYLTELPEEEVRNLAASARARCLLHHTAAARASELLTYIAQTQGTAESKVKLLPRAMTAAGG